VFSFLSADFFFLVVRIKRHCRFGSTPILSASAHNPLCVAIKRKEISKRTITYIMLKIF